MTFLPSPSETTLCIRAWRPFGNGPPARDGNLNPKRNHGAVTLALSIVGTLIVGALVKQMIGLRTPPETERIGLDLAEHGEEAYIL